MFWLASAALLRPALANDTPIIRLAASTENSALMVYLKQHFEAANPYPLHGIAPGSGRGKGDALPALLMPARPGPVRLPCQSP